MFSLCHQTRWNIYNYPSTKQVEYCSLLEEKRAILYLISQYKTLGFKQNLCSIFDTVSKIIETPDVFVTFLCTSFQGIFLELGICTSNTFIQECNKLLLILKQSISLQYYILENHIFIKCKQNNFWNAFYHLYFLYLKKNITTVIGPNFYSSIILLGLVENEKQSLIFFSKREKVIKISKHSVFYRLYSRHKVSLQNFILMLKHMPSCLSTVLHEQTSSSKNLNKASSCYEVFNKQSSKPMKRKTIDILEQPKSKVPKYSCNAGIDVQWKIFCNFKYDFINYSNLHNSLIRNDLQPSFDFTTLRKDANSAFCISNFNEKELFLKYVCEIKENTNEIENFNTEQLVLADKLPIQLTQSKIPATSEQKYKASTSSHAVTADSCVANDAPLFYTASGKAIHVSHKALSAAQNFFEDIISDKRSLMLQEKNENNRVNLSKELEDLDENLIDNFFQDIAFDDEMGINLENSKKRNFPDTPSSVQTEVKCRKSLGGRRTMKFKSLTKATK